MRRPQNEALIITSEASIERSLSAGLSACGLGSVSVAGASEALSTLESSAPECIVFDLDSGTAGMKELFFRVDESLGMNRLLLLVSETSIPQAALAMEWGALWHLRKPVISAELQLVVERIERTAGTRMQGLEDIVYGSSPEIQAVLKVMAHAAERDVHVTVHGEPGSGKRLIARMLHRQSRRRHAPLMHFSCAGLSERVTEGDLFGSQPAVGGSKGFLDSCRGGTLFVDEIDLLQINIQRRLFNYMRENGTGAGASSGSEGVRLIAASCRNLERRAHEGRFHSGLFDLIDSVRIYLPPLREHKSDIPILADHFFRTAAQRLGKPVRGITPEAMVSLMQYDWPGNVRELADLIDHAVRSTSQGVLGPDALPSLPEPSGRQGGILSERATIQEIEREAILRTLESAGGSTSRAARILNMSVRKIQYKLKEYRGDAGTALRVERVRAVTASRSFGSKKSELVGETRARD